MTVGLVIDGLFAALIIYLLFFPQVMLCGISEIDTALQEDIPSIEEIKDENRMSKSVVGRNVVQENFKLTWQEDFPRTVPEARRFVMLFPYDRESGNITLDEVIITGKANCYSAARLFCSLLYEIGNDCVVVYAKETSHAVSVYELDGEWKVFDFTEYTLQPGVRDLQLYSADMLMGYEYIYYSWGEVSSRKS